MTTHPPVRRIGRCGRSIAFGLTLTIAALPPIYGKENSSHLPTTAVRAAINSANGHAESLIHTHTTALHQAIRSRKASNADIAAELTGYKATWILLRYGEEELRLYAQSVLNSAYGGPLWVQQLMEHELASCIAALGDAEDTLARESAHPELSVTTTLPTLPGSADLTAPPEELPLLHAMQMQALTELGSFLGGELATCALLSSRIIATGGTFSWSSLGLGLGVGLAADALVRRVVNPAGKVEQHLDEHLERMAQACSSVFRETMQHHLTARRTRWMQELTHP